MNYLNEVIAQAAKKIGGMQALEDYLELPRKTLSMVGKTRGLPDIAQAKLEELMELPNGSLRAPSAIITEKKPERVAYWKKKLTELEKIAACVLLSVTFFVTPSPAEAAPMLDKSLNTLYIMSNIICELLSP